MQPPYTLPFDVFWQWIGTHPNCILRAGTPESIIYDDDDLHWTFVGYENGALGVQVLRGKRFMGEIFIAAEEITYVQGVLGEVEGEFIFELIAESETNRTALYFFVLTHGYDEEDDVPPVSGRVH